MSPRLAISTLVVLFAVALCATVAGQQRPPPPPAPAYVVIVNPHVGAATLDRGFVEDAFLKKVTTWPDGEVIHPVDLAADSPVRRAFTRGVLNRSVEAVKGYWQQRIFSGRDVPPPELASDDEVVQYVLRHDGGIGYVSGTAALDGCRVVGVQ